MTPSVSGRPRPAAEISRIELIANPSGGASSQLSGALRSSAGSSAENQQKGGEREDFLRPRRAPLAQCRSQARSGPGALIAGSPRRLTLQRWQVYSGGGVPLGRKAEMTRRWIGVAFVLAALAGAIPASASARAAVPPSFWGANPVAVPTDA